MNSPAAPIIEARETALRGSTDLAAAAGGTLKLYTEVPEKARPPYVLHGEDQVLLEDGGCATEAEVFSTIHVWSKPETPDKGAQARAMGAAVIAALALSLEVDGWTVDEWGVESERYVTDPDQSTHGIITLRHLLTEQAA